jgi:molybdate transport repressor ModE-like protein
MRKIRALASAGAKARHALINFMRFDLTDLRLFLAIVEAGSITHGAAEAGLSLSAASERLRDMEAIREIMLLSRGGRGVAPTEAGEILAHHARTILHQMARMRGDIGQYARGLRASVRIFANTAATTEFLPGRLAPWMTAHPQIDVELKERQAPTSQAVSMRASQRSAYCRARLRSAL